MPKYLQFGLVSDGKLWPFEEFIWAIFDQLQKKILENKKKTL
jgi:hypothetical protein